jgi:hypothetical protein
MARREIYREQTGAKAFARMGVAFARMGENVLLPAETDPPSRKRPQHHGPTPDPMPRQGVPVGAAAARGVARRGVWLRLRDRPLPTDIKRCW